MQKKIAKKVTRKTAKSLNPLQVGNKVLIRTVTAFQVGKIVEENEHGYVLVDASWVADTGRFATALAKSDFSEVEPFCAPVFVSKGAIVDATIYLGQLPLNQK